MESVMSPVVAVHFPSKSMVGWPEWAICYVSSRFVDSIEDLRPSVIFNEILMTF